MNNPKLPGANLALAEHDHYAEHYSTPLDDVGPDMGEAEHEVGANGMVVLTLMLRVTGGSAGQVDELARRLLDLGLIQAVVDDHELDDLPVMSVKHSSHAVK